MKVLEKNVYTAKICVCTEHTTTASGTWGTGMHGSTIIKDDVINNEEIFVKVGENDYRQARDLYQASKEFPLLPKFLITKTAMEHFTIEPKTAGNLFIKDIKHVYREDSIQLLNI